MPYDGLHGSSSAQGLLGHIRGLSDADLVWVAIETGRPIGVFYGEYNEAIRGQVDTGKRVASTISQHAVRVYNGRQLWHLVGSCVHYLGMQPHHRS